ncbi:MAG: T9SS type A sorting domain-containing protein [Brumimicrobium sp.]
MQKNIIAFILLFQFSMFSWSQMDMFNETYDFHSDEVSNAWLEMLIRNDSLILVGTSSYSTFTRLEVGSMPLSNPNSMGVSSIWNPVNERYYSGIGKSFWNDPATNDLFITGPIESSTFLAEGFIARTNVSGDSLNVIKSGIDTTDYQSSFYNPTEGRITLAGIKADQNERTDVWLVQYDTSGTLIWENTFGGVESDVSFSIDRTHDGGFVIGGFTRSFGAGMRDVYVVKTDSLGNFEWQHVFGGVNYDTGWLKTVENGNILVYGGIGHETSGSGKGYARKLDSLGNMKWHKEYYYSLSHTDLVQAMTPSSTGYLFAGFSVDEADNNPLGWLLKTDFDGNELWSRRYRKRDSDNYFRDVVELPDGDIMLCGFVFSEDTLSQDAWLVRTNCLGFDTLPEANATAEVLADREIRLENKSKAWGNCIIDWGDGTSNYVYEDYSSFIEHTYPNTDERTIKITALACGDEDTMSLSVLPSTTSVTKETLDNFTLFPNPASNNVTLQIPAFKSNDYEVQFYNNIGRQVNLEEAATATGYEINISGIASGVYQVALRHKNGVVSNKKLVIQH